MCANDALNQKYAPAFLDASYQLEALEGKTAEGWDAARGVTIAFPRLAAVKDSDGGEMKARMKSLWDNCKETVKGFAEIFPPRPTRRWRTCARWRAQCSRSST